MYDQAFDSGLETPELSQEPLCLHLAAVGLGEPGGSKDGSYEQAGCMAQMGVLSIFENPQILFCYSVQFLACVNGT